MRRLPPPSQRQGFAYVEVLLAVLLLAILLVPAMEALTSGVRGSTVQPLQRHIYLRNKLEDVLSKPFSDLDTAALLAGNTTTATSSYSEASGTPNRRMVVLYRYNYATGNQTDSNTGLLFVKVYYFADGNAQDGALQTLVGKWW